MNAQIALLLGQDGITNGAIYALLALSILLVFSVTRILLIPQGEFVTYGALTMAAVQAGKPTPLAWLLLVLTAVQCLLELTASYRAGRGLRVTPGMLGSLAFAALVTLAVYQLPLAELPLAAQALLTLCLVVPLGPRLYRLFFQPIAGATPLVLLIVSIAVHVAMVGIGLLLFGPEGARTTPFSQASFSLADIPLNSQALWVLALSLMLIIALFLFFGRSLYGKALQATAVNRNGARLMGISPELAGKASFGLASFIGGLSGILIAPITTLYFDSGFIISLKGFVGAIIGGLVSYPLAALGAVAVGLVEAFSMFWASNFKEVIVFTLIIPFLLWRSLRSHHVEEEA
ncbi:MULTISPECIES: branched-chain amino acid ABC transporter permease [unclassified Pseudomonas]|uniref:branched-chain amino acid ABC transporter permease n=1 Tax=unclassified Pseudomonas TaxID=196821 RepID=UPI0008C71750|nr:MULTISPECIES: branched-chain amino acid ABC transporter permease [unclassified Pseudomonas]MCD4867126.1 branched-chain amino acid ABC transporter permease [Pseudomonas sp. PLB05]SEP46350.1 branched-chain amino acid transport system permease protein [Pseudomonas sp. Snoq117.2]